MDEETVIQCPKCGTKLKMSQRWDEEYPIHKDTLVCPREGCGYAQDAFSGKPVEVN